MLRRIFSVTFLTEILSTETSDFLKQTIFLRSFNLVFDVFKTCRRNVTDSDQEQSDLGLHCLFRSRSALLAQTCLSEYIEIYSLSKLTFVPFYSRRKERQ